ncbi:MAG: aminopeptidase, partial [Bdellovibrionota bacterium]
VRELLAKVHSIKRFGQDSGLKPTRNYEEFVNLDRPAAVWVVSGAEKLRFKSKEWGFPILGRVPYLGWFDRHRAISFREKLSAEGWDVDVRGAAAFSTLGWFRDPILSTMLPESDEALGELVDIVIHESVHATVYVNGQAFFNESLASFAAEKLTLNYLEREVGVNATQYKAYVASLKAERERAKEMHDAYSKLSALYASQKPDEEKLSVKQEVLLALREQLGIKRDINNATLIQFKEYRSDKEQFEKLLNACGGQWPRFWRLIASIKAEDFKQPQQEDFGILLSPLVEKGC